MLNKTLADLRATACGSQEVLYILGLLGQAFLNAGPSPTTAGHSL